MTMTTSGGSKRSAPVEAYADFEASPLVTQNLLEQIVPVNPELALRWGNRVAGDGLRLNQLIYSGFEVCAPADVKMKSGAKLPEMMVKDGKVMYGDLVALKISKSKYYGALKWNHNVAVINANRTRSNQESAGKVNQEIRKGSRNEIASKISAYVPSDQELEALTKNEGGK